MKDILTEQLKAIYNQTNWFVPLRVAVEGLTEEQAAWQPVDTANSIAQIIAHLLFWNDLHLKRFKGGDIPPMQGNNDTTFNAPESKSWKNTVEKLDAVLTEWHNALTHTDEDKLVSPVSERLAMPWHSIIANINIHNAYHIGQIVLIRKLQGSWDKEKGVS